MRAAQSLASDETQRRALLPSHGALRLGCVCSGTLVCKESQRHPRRVRWGSCGCPPGAQMPPSIYKSLWRPPGLAFSAGCFGAGGAKRTHGPVSQAWLPFLQGLGPHKCACMPALLSRGKGRGQGLAPDRRTEAGDSPVQRPELPPEARLTLGTPGPQSSPRTSLGTPSGSMDTESHQPSFRVSGRGRGWGSHYNPEPAVCVSGDAGQQG